MAQNWRSQRKAEADEVGAITLAEDVYTVYGSTATKLTRPAGTTMLVLHADKGGWRLRMGDRVSAGMPSAVDPGAAITDGTGAIKLKEGDRLVLTAPAEVTVKAYNATDALTYYWL
jgi:hypothetical protein